LSTAVTAALAPAGGAKLIAGTAVAVVSAVLYDAGYILEKRALNSMPPLGANPVTLLRVVSRSRLWLLGFSSMIAGLLLQVAALTLAPVSVVQPVLAAGLVALVAAGGPLLGERLGRRQRTALFLVIGAVVAIAVSSRPGGHLASSVPSGSLAALVLPVALCAVAAAWFGSRLSTAATPAAVLFAASAGLLYGLGAVAEKAVAAKVVGEGVLGGTRSALVSPYPWVFVLVTFAGMVVFQLALQRHAASMVATVSNVVSSVCALTGASLVFGEMLLPSGWWSLARIAGFAGVGAALLLLLGADRRRVEAAVP
jgi:multidrug transporter EmrE-like cation transporter